MGDQGEATEERERGRHVREQREREEDLCERQRAGERINKLIKYYTILLQCALKNESALYQDCKIYSIYQF